MGFKVAVGEEEVAFGIRTAIFGSRCTACVSLVYCLITSGLAFSRRSLTCSTSVSAPSIDEAFFSVHTTSIHSLLRARSHSDISERVLLDELGGTRCGGSWGYCDVVHDLGASSMVQSAFTSPTASTA